MKKWGISFLLMLALSVSAFAKTEITVTSAHVVVGIMDGPDSLALDKVWTAKPTKTDDGKYWVKRLMTEDQRFLLECYTDVEEVNIEKSESTLCGIQIDFKGIKNQTTKVGVTENMFMALFTDTPGQKYATELLDSLKINLQDLDEENGVTTKGKLHQGLSGDFLIGCGFGVDSTGKKVQENRCVVGLARPTVKPSTDKTTLSE